MKTCENCRKPATVVLIEISKGKRRPHLFCASCAPKVEAPAHDMLEEFIFVTGRNTIVELATALSKAVVNEDFEAAKGIDMDLDKVKKDTATLLATVKKR